VSGQFGLTDEQLNVLTQAISDARTLSSPHWMAKWMPNVTAEHDHVSGVTLDTTHDDETFDLKDVMAPDEREYRTRVRASFEVVLRKIRALESSLDEPGPVHPDVQEALKDAEAGRAAHQQLNDDIPGGNIFERIASLEDQFVDLASRFNSHRHCVSDIPRTLTSVAKSQEEIG